ncbi:hypothetical protein F5884DRAFT_897299 [Xylogone sp. PMI_703]|nr:hypothetical protein F5884DRAFT_897299 [Xylogone sp. PMI_703]
MASAIDAEFRDPARIELLTTLQGLLEERELPPPSGAVWGALWLSDLEQLQEMVKMVEQNLPLASLLLLSPTATFNLILSPWLHRPVRTSPESATLASRLASASPPRTSKGKHRAVDDVPGSPSHKRQRTNTAVLARAVLHGGIGTGDDPGGGEASAGEAGEAGEAAKKALRRDRLACVLTSLGQPVQVCHIYPYALRNKIATGTFWNNLSLFWSQDRIARWKAAINAERHTETPQNLLTLCPNAHAYWDRAMFALQPLNVSNDGASLTVKFFWLHHNDIANTASVDAVPRLPDNLKSTRNIALHGKTGTALRSGRIFHLKTEDPLKYPLPSRDLLEMQWILHRLAAISGAADIINDDYGNNEQLYQDSFLRSPQGASLEDSGDELVLDDMSSSSGSLERACIQSLTTDICAA